MQWDMLVIRAEAFRYVHTGVLALFYFDSLLLMIYATDYLFLRFSFPVNLLDVSKNNLGKQQRLVCSKGCSP